MAMPTGGIESKDKIGSGQRNQQTKQRFCHDVGFDP
jgi:hypothetical protein